MLKKSILMIGLLFVLATPVYAQEIDLPGPGILPTSPLYGLERFFEHIGVLITFDNEAKAERHLLHAEERLAELVTLADKKVLEDPEDLLTPYQNEVDNAKKYALAAKDDGRDIEDVLSHVSEVTTKHQAVLADVYDKVPEAAKPGIERAMEASLKEKEEKIEDDTGEKKNELKKNAEESREKVEEKLQELQEEKDTRSGENSPQGNADESNEKVNDVKGLQTSDLPEQAQSARNKIEKKLPPVARPH